MKRCADRTCVSRSQWRNLNPGSNKSADARLDVHAREFWERQRSTLFDVWVCHPNAGSRTIRERHCNIENIDLDVDKETMQYWKYQLIFVYLYIHTHKFIKIFFFLFIHNFFL